MDTAQSPTGTFDTDRFIERCRQAVREQDPDAALVALMREAVSDPASVASSVLPVADDKDELILFSDDSVSVYVVKQFPEVGGPPHDHGMTAVVGMYDGIEVHHLWDVTEDGGLSEKPAGMSDRATSFISGRRTCTRSPTRPPGPPTACMSITVIWPATAVRSGIWRRARGLSSPTISIALSATGRQLEQRFRSDEVAAVICNFQDALTRIAKGGRDASR